MAERTPSELVDSLVIDVHLAVPGRHGESLGPIIRRWALAAPGIAIDLAEFVLAGSLTDDVAFARFPFLPLGEVRAGLDAIGDIDAIDDDLGRFLDARAETAADRWARQDASVDRAIGGATQALGVARRDLAVAFRTLPLPQDAPMRLHHLLTGLRYERLGAHVDACDGAGLSRDEAVALSTAWSTDQGSITPSDRALRDRIEAETEAACEPMWRAVTDLDGWLSALRELEEPAQSRRPASS